MPKTLRERGINITPLTVYKVNGVYYRQKVFAAEDNENGIINIGAEDLFFADLIDLDSAVFSRSGTVSGLLNELFAGTKFTAGACDDFGNITLDVRNVTKLRVLNDILDKTGGELYRSGLTAAIFNRLNHFPGGVGSAYPLFKGVNVITLSENIDTSGMITQLRYIDATEENPQERIIQSAHINNYPLKEAYKEFQGNADAQAAEYLAVYELPVASYKVSVINKAAIKFELGALARLYCEQLGIDLQLRVAELTRDLTGQEGDLYTLGQKPRTFLEQIADMYMNDINLDDLYAWKDVATDWASDMDDWRSGVDDFINEWEDWEMPDWEDWEEPNWEDFVPDWEKFIPDWEEFIPDWEEFLPDWESFLPDWDTLIPELIEDILNETVGDRIDDIVGDIINNYITGDEFINVIEEVIVNNVLVAENAMILNAWIRGLTVEEIETNFDAIDLRLPAPANGQRDYIHIKGQTMTLYTADLSNDGEDYIKNGKRQYYTAIDDHPQAYQYFTATPPEQTADPDAKAYLDDLKENNPAGYAAAVDNLRERFAVKIRTVTELNLRARFGFDENHPSRIPYIQFGVGDGTPTEGIGTGNGVTWFYSDWQSGIGQAAYFVKTVLRGDDDTPPGTLQGIRITDTGPEQYDSKADRWVAIGTGSGEGFDSLVLPRPPMIGDFDGIDNTLVFVYDPADAINLV